MLARPSPKVLYLYAGARRKFFEQWQKGLVPDTQLLGLNHLKKFGVNANFVEWSFCEWLRRINFNLVHLPYILLIKKYDVVFICAGLPLVFLAKWILRWKKPKFVIYNTYLTNALTRNRRGLSGFIIRKAIENLDVIICTAKDQVKFLIDAGFNPKKIIYQPIGIDAAAVGMSEKKHVEDDDLRACANNHANSDSDSYILSVGRDLGRDYQTLFEAVKNLPIKVKVATKPETVAGLQPPDNVEILYHVPYEEMPLLYRRALFAVVPLRDTNDPKGSDTSGQYGYLEPMAAGKAVIVSDKSVVRDYIENNRDGILVPPQNPEALRAAIKNLLQNPSRATTLGATARRKVREKFTSEKFAEKLAEIFKTV
jgi:glycosyltransferase involved in cell wall biosynthesis